MPTTVLTNLDALTGPTTSGSLTGMTDSQPNSMGGDITGTASDSGSMISSQTKTKYIESSGDYKCSMTVDFDGAIIQIPSDAQIYKVQITAASDYAANALAQYTRTAGSGNVNGQVGIGITAALGGGGTFTPTSSTVINDGATDSADITTTSFNLAVSKSGSPNLLREFNFEPAGSNAEAPLGYISRAQLVSQFTSVYISMVINALTQISTGINNGTFSQSVTASLQTNLWIMRVFWNPGVTVTDVTPNPIESGDTGTLTGSGLDAIDELEFHYDDENGDPQVVPIPDFNWDGVTFTFTMPDMGFVGYDGPVIGTLFWGSVSLIALSVLYTNGSGIYRFSSGKRNDTVYDHNGGTTDGAIPRPFGKTGYIGG